MYIQILLIFKGTLSIYINEKQIVLLEQVEVPELLNKDLVLYPVVTLMKTDSPMKMEVTNIQLKPLKNNTLSTD